MTSFQGYSATRAQTDELFTILSIMRPHGSLTEAKFINTFIKPLKPMVDACGNLMVKVGNAPVVWSCHVDTVHRFGGMAPVAVDDKGIVGRHSKSMANCLGADDGAGVWIMLQMIRAGRPGLYIFHRGEECGGIGSRWIAKNTPKILDGIDFAIAFDRKGTGSIITHQFGGRCCSEDFSKSLSKAIGLGMKSDNGGSFTDTASYTDLVPECTNVSVGYYGQHGAGEEQDLLFLLTLHDHMLDVDVHDLVVKRKRGEKEARKYNYGGYGGWAGGWSDMFDDGDQTPRHGGRSFDADYAYLNDPKLKWAKGKSWSATDKGWIWPNADWDADKKIWVERSTKSSDKGEKGVRSFMDARNTHVTCRKVNGHLVKESYLALVEDFPMEVAAMLADKKYGFSYIHDQIRAYGGKIETAYSAPDKPDTVIAGKTVVCGKCSRLKQYCCCN